MCQASVQHVISETQSQPLGPMGLSGVQALSSVRTLAGFVFLTFFARHLRTELIPGPAHRLSTQSNPMSALHLHHPAGAAQSASRTHPRSSQHLSRPATAAPELRRRTQRCSGALCVATTHSASRRRTQPSASWRPLRSCGSALSIVAATPGLRWRNQHLSRLAAAAPQLRRRSQRRGGCSGAAAAQSASRRRASALRALSCVHSCAYKWTRRCQMLCRQCNTRTFHFIVEVCDSVVRRHGHVFADRDGGSLSALL